MDHSEILRLIVIDDSPNEMEALSNILRKAGYGVRPVLVEDEEDLVSALKGQSPDLILCRADFPELSVEQAARAINEAGQIVPLIAIGDRVDETTLVAALRAGARDLVSQQQPEHLQLVVARELENLELRRALKRCEKSYRESEKRCRSLLDSSRDAISYVHEGMHVYCNTAYLAMFGFSELEDLEGMPLMNLVAPEDHGKLKDFLRRYSKGADERAELEILALRADGETFKAQMEFTPASIEGERCTQIVVRDDSIDQDELESRIRQLSNQDLLTGLYNRQYFIQVLDSTISEIAEAGGEAVLFFIAPDNFKAIKENVGIAVSDLMLGDFATLLKQKAGENDVVARFGDDTFAILTRGCDLEGANALAERIRSAVENHVFEVADHSVATTCSIGVTQVDGSVPNVQEALTRVDIACETARSAGGNKVHVHSPVVNKGDQGAQAELWEAKIKEALEKDRFRLVYQPIMALRGEQGAYYEALVRMLDEQGNDIMPSQFLPTAEQTGLITEIDRWVIKHAIGVLQEQRRLGRDIRFFIKLSGRSLTDTSLLPWIHEQLTSARLSERNIIFEVAESVAASHLASAKTFLQGLKNLHCKVALNRFGANANSFALLKHLPADYLKIDGSLICNVRDPETQAEVKKITEKAQAMGKQTVAEFVESADSLTVLWNCGVNYIQGNFLQAPDGSLSFDFGGESL